jgi:hypothetical protein
MDETPQSDLENGSTAEASIGGTTQTTLDTVDYYDKVDEEQVHDQLPSVEEYKTNMTGAAGPPSPLMARVDMGTTGGGGEDDDVMIHDQLPTVDEYKASNGIVTQAADSGSSCKRKCCCTLFAILFVGLIASAILIPVAMMRDGEGARVRLFSRRQKVVDYLVEHSISDEEKLNTPGTPQYEAALWIADHDTYQMDIPDKPEDRFLERYVLALFYHATGGSRWRYNPNFMTGADVCDWNGETLSPNTANPIFMGVTGCKELITNDGVSKRYVRDIFLCKRVYFLYTYTVY